MKKRLFCVLSLLCLVLVACFANGGDGDFEQDRATLAQWRVGRQVRLQSVNEYGIDKCFVAEMIDDDIFKRIWKKSYKADCTIPRTELRYVKVLHYTLDGKIQLGELVCNKSIARDLVEIFHALFDAKYPIERMVLIDDYDAQDELSMTNNNTSCFNFRFVSGTKKLSSHSRGLAIDINTLYNPCVKRRKDGTLRIEPKAGKPYADRTKAFRYKITRNDLCYKLFMKHGFTWGGDWARTKDYQHFEKTK